MNKFPINKNNEPNKKSILIEYDAGYISPKDNREFISEMNKLAKGEKIIEEPLVVYAVMQKYDVENRNGRIYPEKILKRESEKYKEMINKGMSISELNHPESSLIDLDRVAHLITDIWWEDNILMGKIKLLTTPGFH